MKNWLEKSGIQSSYIFRAISKNQANEDKPLIPLAVNQILIRRAKKADISKPENLSAHSLHRGLATSASRDGASIPAIMRQSR